MVRPRQRRVNATTNASSASCALFCVSCAVIWGVACWSVSCALGVILVIVGPFEWDDPWVGLSLLIYLAAMFFSLFVHQPNLKAMDGVINELAAMGPPPGAAGEGPPPGAGGPPPQVVELERRGKLAARNGGILHLAFAVILILMIFGARGAFV